MNPAAPLVLWRNARICPAGDSGEVIDRGAIAAQGDRIVWIGDDQHIPVDLAAAALRAENLQGRWITPGFVDCHTHLVFASSRADEFRMRLAGATYQEIARSGGGINSTVRATRSAGEESLYQQSARRLKALLAEGVTALEIKSGYGLNLETERKMLRVARRLGQEFPVSIYTTFLGAHAVPDESTGRADDYIRSVCDEMLPTLHREGLVDAVDVFCENIAFTAAQSERVFQKAVDLGLPVKIHAGQLSDLGAVRLAARYRALSADHLEHLDEPAVRDMKTAGMVAVLLPGASYFLREARRPPVDLLRRHQVPIAVATDCNPGTSPATSILLTMNLACTLFRLTPDEALAAVTRHAAQALGKATDHGLLAEGRYADFCVWDIDSLAELGYWMGFNPCHAVIRHGVVSQGEL